MDDSAYVLLKTIWRHPETSFGMTSNQDDQLHFLLQMKYIVLKEETNLNLFKEPTKETRRRYTVTITGKAFIKSHRAITVDKWFTRSLAIAAFIISVIALLKP